MACRLIWFCRHSHSWRTSLLRTAWCSWDFLNVSPGFVSTNTAGNYFSVLLMIPVSWWFRCLLPVTWLEINLLLIHQVYFRLKLSKRLNKNIQFCRTDVVKKYLDFLVQEPVFCPNLLLRLPRFNATNTSRKCLNNLVKKAIILAVNLIKNIQFCYF